MCFSRGDDDDGGVSTNLNNNYVNNYREKKGSVYSGLTSPVNERNELLMDSGNKAGNEAEAGRMPLEVRLPEI